MQSDSKEHEGKQKVRGKKYDTVMGWYQKFREERTLPFPTTGKNALPPHLQANREAAMSIQSYGRSAMIIQ